MRLLCRAVIFDLDGTLVDSYEALLIAVNSSLHEHQRPAITIDQMRRFVGEGIEPLSDLIDVVCVEGGR